MGISLIFKGADFSENAVSKKPLTIAGTFNVLKNQTQGYTVNGQGLNEQSCDRTEEIECINGDVLTFTSLKQTYFSVMFLNESKVLIGQKAFSSSDTIGEHSVELADNSVGKIAYFVIQCAANFFDSSINKDYIIKRNIE